MRGHRLTEAGIRLLERAMPAWRAAQRQAHEFLGGTTVRDLNKFATETGFNG